MPCSLQDLHVLKPSAPVAKQLEDQILLKKNIY